MKVVKCSNGHYYDKDKNTECPFCNEKNNSGLFDSERNLAKMLAARQKSFECEIDDEKTKSIYTNNNYREDPIVGWLVCEEGSDLGKSYNLYNGKNTIGCSEQDDIQINTTGKFLTDYCSIIFEPLECDFYIQPGIDCVVYLNNIQINKAVKIENEDVITLKDVKLRLIAYCKKGRVWK